MQSQSTFIDNDYGAKLSFNRDWEKLRKDIEAIQVKDKSDFFAAIMKASRLLMGNDDDQAGKFPWKNNYQTILKIFARNTPLTSALFLTE